MTNSAETYVPPPSGTGVKPAPIAPTRALAVREETAIARRVDPTAFEPTSLAEAFEFADHVVKSQYFAKLKSREQAFMVLATARELEIPMMAGLRNIIMIPSKKQNEGPSLCMMIQLQIALVRRNPECRYLRLKHDPRKPGLSEAEQKYAIWESLKRGEDQRVEEGYYTIADAERAGYFGGREYTDDNGNKKKTWPKDNWVNDPGSMLVARAAGRLIRQEWSQVLLGLSAVEEIEEDGPIIDITPSRTPSSTPPKPIVDADASLLDRRQNVKRRIGELIVLCDGVEDDVNELLGHPLSELKTIDESEEAIERAFKALEEKKAARPVAADPSPPQKTAAQPELPITSGGAKSSAPAESKERSNDAGSFEPPPKQSEATPPPQGPVKMSDVLAAARKYKVNDRVNELAVEIDTDGPKGRFLDKLSEREWRELIASFPALHAQGVVNQEKRGIRS